MAPKKNAAASAKVATPKAAAAGGKKEPERKSASASKAESRQRRAEAEAARLAAVDTMLNPPSDAEESEEDEAPLTSGGNASGRLTLAQVREQQAQEKECLERAKAEARQRGEERLAERERQRAEKERQKSEKKGGDGMSELDKVLAKVESEGTKKLSNKERRLYAKHMQKQEEEAEFESSRTAAQQLGAEAARIAEAVKDFSVSMPDDSARPGAVDLRLEDFSVSAGGTHLFDNASLTLAQGRHYGLLGPNGQGKTTLLRLLAAGRLPVPDRWRLGFVEQEAEKSDFTVVEEVLASDTTRRKLLEEEAELLRKLESGGDDADELADLCKRLADVGDELEVSGADAAEGKVRRILYGLAFTAKQADGPVSELSGGWRMRVSLAKALFMEPDLLLLDEPTNHLDLDAVLWLDDYLSNYPKTLLVVSHDADFLDSVCTDIVHLEERKLIAYKGGYTQFKKLHAQHVKEREKEVEKQQKEKSKGKKQTEEELTKLRDYVVKFRFLEPARTDEMAGISVDDVTFSYSGKQPWLLKKLNFRFDGSTRVAVLGVNGSGKSTLLSLVAKDLEPTSGEVHHSRRLAIGRYSQHFDEIQPFLNMSAVEYLTSPELRRFLKGTESPELAHRCLGQFGLPSHAHRRPMKELSGGQKARVCFASITCRAPELLILDEPTNHLDIESVEALIDAMKKFHGGLLLVTHDARLIKATNCELRVCKGSESPELGKVESFDDYRKQVLKGIAKRQTEAEEEAQRKAAARRKKREEALKKAPGGKSGGFAPPTRSSRAGAGSAGGRS